MKLNYQHLTDNELVRLYQQSACDHSIKELVTRHKDKIFTGIFYIVKDRYIAEDIFQETLIKAAGNIRKGKYTEQGKFAPWVSRIAHNLCIDYIRKSKSSHAIKTVDSDLLNVEQLSSASSYNSDTMLEHGQTESQLWKIINKLPQEQMEVIVMRIYGQMSFKEISVSMGVSINTSLGRMRYGLINLRKMIQENQMVLR